MVVAAPAPLRPYVSDARGVKGEVMSLLNDCRHPWRAAAQVNELL
jgi:hypothetical protein